MAKKICVDEIDGVYVPVEYRERYYDKRAHKKRVKTCKCGTMFYDDSVRVSNKLCYPCRLEEVSLNEKNCDLEKLRLDPRRSKYCRLCGEFYTDASFGISRRYCFPCLAKHSYDVLDKLVEKRGKHLLSVDGLPKDTFDKVKLAYNGFKSDVQIAKELKLNEDQVRYVRKKLGLQTVSYDLRRVNSGLPSIKNLTEDEIKQSIKKRLPYATIAEKFGVKPCTIKAKLKHFEIDRLLFVYQPIDISDRSIEIIIGHLLGDGSIVPVGRGKGAYFKVGHKIADKDYTEWTANELSGLEMKIRTGKKIIDGRIFEFSTCSSVRTSSLLKLHKLFYDSSLKKKHGTDGCKNPGIEVFENLSDLSLAIWYMDDGSYDNGLPNIAMFFPAADYDSICKALTKRFGIEFYYVSRKRIKLLKIKGRKDREKFFSIVSPYVVSRMTRKLPPKFRTGLSYSNDDFSSRFPTSGYHKLCEQDKIKFIDDFVNEMLVIDPFIRKLDQEVGQYLSNLHDKLEHVIPNEDGSLPYLNDGLTYLDGVCTHRFTSNHDRELSFVEAWKDRKIMEKVVKNLLDRNQPLELSYVSRRVMEMVTAPGHFRPSGAAALLNHYRPKSVLDPFAGWCGRALACVLNKNVKSYTGIDLQPQTVEGIRRILYDTQHLGPCMVHAHCVDALKFMNETNEKYDMILAGPPYYNIENYNGVEQKGTYNEWLENFVKPFCDFSSRVLNNKGVLALHIYDTHKYAFIESFMFFLNQFGLSHVKQFKFGFLKKTGRPQFVHIFSKIR